MTDDAEKCPMMILEVEVARHTDTTYGQVADGLARAGVMKHLDIIDPGDATPEQVERLQGELMGFMIHSDVFVERREEHYADLKARLAEVEVTLRLSKDAQQMQRARRFARRVLVLLDVVDELTGPHKKMAREVGSEMARSARNDVEAFLKADEETEHEEKAP